MNSNIIRRFGMAIFALVVFSLTIVFSSDAAPLEIIQPVDMESINTSNVLIKVQLDSTDPSTFSARMNGKPVETLFQYDASGVAEGLISAADGLNASINGPRMNVFTAEVVGQDGKKFKKMIQFTVDCSGNTPPVAQASVEGGAHAIPGETLVLDGSGSADADDDPLTYRWAIVVAPHGSQAKLSNELSARPSFVPDVPGDYEVALTVDDYKETSEPSMVTITAGELSILIDRPIRNPIFELLREYSVVEQYDGSQNPGDYRLAIVDAENQSPEALYDNPLVAQALADGTWVLALNVTEEQKEKGFIRYLGLASGEESVAFMFRRQIGSDGMPFIQIEDLPLLVLHVIPPRIDPEDFLWYADTILKTLKPGRMSDPGYQIPGGLINARFVYTVAVPWTMTWSGRHPSSDGLAQRGIHNITYTFALFLDNAYNWRGNKQYLLLNIDGAGNPNIDGSSFISEDRLEYAWFQDRFTVKVTPLDGFLTMLTNGPETPNPATTYTTGASFSLQFNASATPGATGTFSYSSSKSYTLTDWVILNDSAGNVGSWDTFSQNPAYPNDGDYRDWFKISHFPMTPNYLSLHSADYHATAVWMTDSLVDQAARFRLEGSQHIAQTSCRLDLGLFCMDGLWGWSQQNQPYETSFVVELGRVIPTEIAAITFDQYPVLVGPAGRGTIKGSVVFKEPRKFDAVIEKLESNSLNAAPRFDRITVPAGKQTATFEIDVNAGGVENPYSQYFASISAFYGKQYSQQLTMEAVDATLLPFPKKSPSWSTDLHQWGGLTGPPNWLDDYLVRYAVSFVYQGNKESEMGPWSDWLGPGYALSMRAMPLLTDIPTDPSGAAIGRKIYRQFFANYDSTDPSWGVEHIGTLNDNTTTTYLDNNP